MKKFCLVLFLIFPLALFSQSYVPQKPPLLFSLNINDLRTIFTSKNSLVKMSDKEIVEIDKIISQRKEEFYILKEKGKKSIPYGENGLPIGKVDPEIKRESNTLTDEVCTSIYKILGEKRYEQFDRTLMNESARRNMERMNKAMKNKKK